jgi:hypothetical protein
MVGIIIAPIIAGLFVTVWKIYGIACQDVLPSDSQNITSKTNSIEDILLI